MLFMALHGAPAYEAAVNDPTAINGQPNAMNQSVGAKFFYNWNMRINETPWSFTYNSYTPRFVAYVLFAWGFGALYYFTTRKKLISYKEYGTAEWATTKDIQHLFADNIRDKELKKLRQSRWWLMRIWLKHKEKKRILTEYRARSKPVLRKLKLLDRETTRSHLEGLKLYRDQSLEELEEKHRKLTIEEHRQEMEKIIDKYEDADMLFTQTERVSIYNFQTNINTMIIGGSGSGKTRGYVMPNLLQAHSSFVITDPKGEILEKSGHFLRDVMGYDISVLNLDRPEASDSYNPFHYLRKDRDSFEKDVLNLIETLIINTDGGEKRSSSTDPFWEKAEQLFLQAVFYFTAYGFPPEEANMNTVMQLIRMLDIKEERDNRDSDLDLFCKAFAKKFGNDNIGVVQFEEFRGKAAGKTAKSIVISAVARLAPFRIAEIAKMVSNDNMKLDQVGERKTAIFIVVPPIAGTYNFLAGMVFTQLFQEINYCASVKYKHKGMRLPVPCRFILDEYANTCKIPNDVKMLAYARSFGVGITIILQSLEQIKEMHKDDWGVMVDNCNTLLYLGKVTHEDTLKYLSNLIGKGTFDKQSSSRTWGRQGSSSKNNDRLGRELLDPSEIRKMPEDKCLFFVSGANAFYSTKYDYTQHPNYRYTSDGNREYSFEYIPDRIQQKKAEKLTPSPLPEAPSYNIMELEAATQYIARNLVRLEFAENEIMMVDDGEPDNIMERFLAEDRKKDLVVSEAVRQFVEEIKSEKSLLITEPKQVVPMVLSMMKQGIREPDSVELVDTAVDDGEELPNPVVDDEFLDDEEQLTELNDIIADIEQVENLLESLNEYIATESEDTSEPFLMDMPPLPKQLNK